MSGVIQFWRNRIHGQPVPVSNDDPLPVTPISAGPTGTPQPVSENTTYTDKSITAATGSDQVILAANTSRIALEIFNDINSGVVWVINPNGGTAAAGATGCFTMNPGDTYTPVPAPKNAIHGISSASAKLTISEGT